MKLKFNLNFGGEQVRTIEDVRTQAINAREILSEIIKTFQENEETDPAYVEVDFSMFNYFDGGNKFRADFHPEKFSAKLDEALQKGSSQVIQEYFRGYEAIIQDIIAHPDDLTYIYDRLDDIVANYLPLILFVLLTRIMNLLWLLLKITIPLLNLLLIAKENAEILYLTALMSNAGIRMAAFIFITWRHGNEFPVV